MEFPVRTIKDFGKVVFSIVFLLSFYSCKNSNSRSVPEKDEIVITVKSDGNIKIQEADRFTAKKGDKWEKLRSSAEAKIKVDDGFEIKSWHLGDVAGVALKGSYQFNKDSTVVVTSKRKALVTASYKVEHWKQNIENDEYEKESEETKTGEVGKDTEAASKTYVGFKAKAVSQAKVKADGSTVVRIEYDRNITSIVLDLDGGETTTQLEAGEGNRKLLKGKFGAKVEIENPTKQGSLFVGWKPALPEKFLAEDDGAVYKAEWESNEASYKVEHWKQNIENDEYKKEEEEAKTGEVGKDTEAIAKTYVGFKAKAVIQAKVKADGSTTIKIEYDRNITSIILDLDGGETTTKLEKGEGNRKLLKGKFEAKIEIEKPTKIGSSFVEWEPSLPEKFLAENDGIVYKAKWEGKEDEVYINGDERLDIVKNTKLDIDFSTPKTWAEIKAQVKAKAPLKAEWNDGDYGIYEWRENDENGKLINDNTPIRKGMKLFAITNYIKFKVEETKLIGYNGGKPRGKIIIDKSITEVAKKAFNECREISRLDFSRCVNLTKIEEKAFENCRALITVDLSNARKLTIIGKEAFNECKALMTVNLLNCESLANIEDRAFGLCYRLENIDLSNCPNLIRIGVGSLASKSLTHVDLSKCTKLERIERSAFMNCINLRTVNLSEVQSLTHIGSYAFYYCGKLKTMDFSELQNLTSIGDHAFLSCEGLKTIDLSKCTKLTKIAEWAFASCVNATLTLPASIQTLDEYCFGNREEAYCKLVIAPNDEIQQKVIDSDYPENRVKVE